MDGELVNKVTEQVVAMLRQRGVAITSTAPRAAAAASPAPRARQTDSEGPSVRRVFITAEMLMQRLAGAGGGVIELAPYERLTPGATDLVDLRRLTIRRTVPAPAAPGPTPAKVAESNPTAVAPKSPPNPGRTVGIVTAAANDKVRSVLASLAREGLAVRELTGGDCWIADLRRLCQAIAGGEVARGVAILPYAADAMVLAGKIKGICPVQGTRVESVAAALRHFGTNLLVLEHAVSTYHELRTMLSTFASGVCGAGGAVAAALAEWERS